MKITTFEAGYIGTNAFLLTDSERAEAVLIDAPHEVEPGVRRVLEQEGCNLTTLVLTHGHWDHTGDAARIKAMGAKVMAHQADQALIETPSVMGAFLPPGIEVEPVVIDRLTTKLAELEKLAAVEKSMTRNFTLDEAVFSGILSEINSLHVTMKHYELSRWQSDMVTAASQFASHGEDDHAEEIERD